MPKPIPAYLQTTVVRPTQAGEMHYRKGGGFCSALPLP
jgi:hypothetical protein